jgi:hypothetical protein
LQVTDKVPFNIIGEQSLLLLQLLYVALTKDTLASIIRLLNE